MRRGQTAKEYKCSYRLGLLSAGLAIWVLLLDLSLSAARIALADPGSQITPTAAIDASGATDHLSAVQKRIVLRTEDGTPVPGIEVQLAPADRTLGGPEAGAEVKKANTRSDGTATFSGLGQWVWTVSFSGSFGGKVMQSVQEQAKAPYGRTRSGGGFPVIVQRQEEDVPATPIVLQGTPLPEVQPSLFVLVPVERTWVPTLDLALPGEHPQPLSRLQGAEATSPPSQPTTGTFGATTSTSGALLTEEGLDSIFRWLYLLPAVIGLFAIGRTWQERRERRQKDLQTRVNSDSDIREEAR